ncbi:MAG TPA: hypothetical protein VLM85_13205 [Polyangiaceae bacterium]|nr:hypothetical protein [Polyangiaceae bacterium]
MTTKKANTDPTFPAPPANAPPGEPEEAAPGSEPIDEILDGLGKPAPDRAYAAPKSPPPKAAHDTIPVDNVILREPTQPGLGDGLNVTPEERARLDALMKAHARRHAEGELGELPAGDRDADTSPPMRRLDRHDVKTDPSARRRRASALPKIGLLVAGLVAAAVIVFVATRQNKQSGADGAASSATATTATTAPTATATTPTATATDTVPAIPTTNVESLPSPTATGRPVATGRPAHTATSASNGQPAHAASTATTAAPTSTQPPPPGMHLLPDDPHK